MTKTQRLEWENKKMKETLERVHCLCEMTGEERRQYMREKDLKNATFPQRPWEKSRLYRKWYCGR